MKSQAAGIHELSIKSLDGSGRALTFCIRMASISSRTIAINTIAATATATDDDDDGEFRT